MRIRLLTVGKPRDREAAALHDRYAQRYAGLGVSYRSDHVAEVTAGKRYSAEHVREREARLIMDALGTKGRVIALDPGGKLMASPDLARRLPHWLMPQATFVIGGPLGLHSSILDRADWTWSLSPLTLPHELARIVTAEQLYRALTIWKNVPYHK